MLEALLDVISASLDNSTLFVEPYVSYPTGGLPSLTRPPSAAPTSTTRLVYSTTFIATARTLDTSTHLMKTLLLALVSTGKSRGTREGDIRGLVVIEGHGAKGVAQESDSRIQLAS